MVLDFSEEDFYLDIQDVKLKQVIGSGQFSEVYLAHYFGDVVAVKKQTRDTTKIENYLYRELGLLKNISHENLLRYLGACNVISEDSDVPHAVYIVTEYCNGGDLLRLVLRGGPGLGWRPRARVLAGAARALAHVHGRRLIHRDIKTSNILVNTDFSCKLADFGFVREVGENMTVCGTDEYMAPELLFDEPFDTAADIFSFGVVLLETILRTKIGHDKDLIIRKPQTCFKINFEEVFGGPEMPKDAPPPLVELTKECLSYEPGPRPSAAALAARLAALLEDTAPGAALGPPEPEEGTAFPLPPLAPEEDLQLSMPGRFPRPLPQADLLPPLFPTSAADGLVLLKLPETAEEEQGMLGEVEAGLEDESEPSANPAATPPPGAAGEEEEDGDEEDEEEEEEEEGLTPDPPAPTPAPAGLRRPRDAPGRAPPGTEPSGGGGGGGGAAAAAAATPPPRGTECPGAAPPPPPPPAEDAPAAAAAGDAAFFTATPPRGGPSHKPGVRVGLPPSSSGTGGVAVDPEHWRRRPSVSGCGSDKKKLVPTPRPTNVLYSSGGKFLTPAHSVSMIGGSPWTPLSVRDNSTLDMDESTLIDLVSHLSIRIGALSPGVSTDTIEDEAEIQDVLYEGWLYKRNAVGYSNWKKRWFMLAGPVLLWWRSPEARRVSPRHPLGLLNIIGGEIRRTKAFRWQILGVIQPKALESKAIPDMATDGKAALERESEEGTSVAKGQGDDLLDRELSATGPAEMEEWIGRLLLAMRGYAQPSSPQSASSEVGDCRPSAASQNGVQYSFGGDGEDEDLVPVVFSAAPRSVRAWLGSLGLSALWPTFKKKGYTDISHIRTFGLVDEDLDYLGITKKQHRHTLKKVVQAIYSPELEVKIESAVLIPGHAEEGKRSKEQPQLQIRARARHGLARSAARVPWAEVEAADADLRATLAGSPLLLRRFPKLPRFGRGTYERNTGQNKKKVVYLVKQDFLKSVKQYFDEVVPLLRGAEPYLSMLRGLFKLEYVDIYSQTDEEEDEYDDDEVDDAFVEQYLSGSLEAGQFSIRQQEKQTV